MENKKELTKQEKEIMEFVWNKITTPKTINEADLTDKIKATYDILGKKTSNELTKNGVVKKVSLVVREKMNLDKMKTIYLTIQSNNITLNQLMLGKYYIAPFTNGNYQIFKKYTSIVEDFKKEHPEFIIQFNIENDNYVECVLTNIEKNYTISNKCFWSEAARTQRPKIDFLRSKAFKDILRYNYPKFVEFYDENDEEVIRQNNDKTNTSLENEKTQELTSKLLKAIKE